MRVVVVLLSGAISALAAGCTVEVGEVADKDKNTVFTCTDTRDGEVFKFNTNTVRNIRSGIGAPSSFDVTTLDGREKTLHSDMDSWLKCERGRKGTTKSRSSQ